jgi:hypothetical protein
MYHEPGENDDILKVLKEKKKQLPAENTVVSKG